MIGHTCRAAARATVSVTKHEAASKGERTLKSVEPVQSSQQFESFRFNLKLSVNNSARTQYCGSQVGGLSKDI